MQVGSMQAFALQENVPNFLTTSAHSQSMANDSEQEHSKMSYGTRHGQTANNKTVTKRDWRPLYI